MKIKKLTKYTIYAVAVLSAALINEQISKYVKQHIDQQGYILVLIDMGIIVLIFAPAFGLVNKYTKKISQVYLKTSRKLPINNKKAILLGFFAAIFVLFLLYAKLRHNLDFIEDIKAIIPLKNQ